MAGVTLREATAADVPRIRDIHNQDLEDRVATLDVEPHTLDEQREWFQRYWPRYPVVVAEVDGEVIGWASLNPFSPRTAYQFVADLSVYIERQWPGKGIGSLLLQDIVRRAKTLGYTRSCYWPFCSTRQACGCMKNWLSHRRDLPRTGTGRRSLRRYHHHGEAA